MFCKHCGKRIDDDSTFCQYCGGRQGSTAAAKTAPPAEDEFDGLDSFFSDAVSQKRAEEAKAAEMAKRFEIKDGVLVKYTAPNPPEPHVVVPDGVTSIGENVFKSAYWLTEVTLPNTLQRIGDWAFAGSLLEKINLPDSVFRIGSFAFQATRLREITFPEKITHLPNSVLQGCRYLERVTLPSRLTTIGQYAFSGSSISAIRIPTSVTEIAVGAFERCEQLSEIALPKGLKSLGASAFSESGIKSLQLPDSITAVPTALCSWCKNLETVALGKYTVSIEDKAFGYCHSLKTVRCGEMLESIGGDRIWSDPFAVQSDTPAETLTLYIPSTLRELRGDYCLHDRPVGKLVVEFGGTYSQWNAVIKPKNFYSVRPENLHCNGIPSVGDAYLFGSYINYHGDVKPIEWIVLSVGAERMLLLSKYVLEYAAYHHEKLPITWERSDLRRWLNHDFLDMAFTQAEQGRILSTTVINENNPEYRTLGGNTTTDKLFCLSISEYRGLRREYQIAPEYDYSGIVSGHHKGNPSVAEPEWWLRTPGGFEWVDERGKESVYASFSHSGQIMGWGSVEKEYGIRPAMWIKK